MREIKEKARQGLLTVAGMVLEAHQRSWPVPGAPASSISRARSIPNYAGRLEGSEWGINARMYLTRRQSRTFTFRPPYPPGALGIRRRRWWIWLLGAILLGTVLFYWIV